MDISISYPLSTLSRVWDPRQKTNVCPLFFKAGTQQDPVGCCRRSGRGLPRFCWRLGRSQPQCATPACAAHTLNSQHLQEDLAHSVDNTGGVYFVPAFSGLLAPRLCYCDQGPRDGKGGSEPAKNSTVSGNAVVPSKRRPVAVAAPETLGRARSPRLVGGRAAHVARCWASRHSPARPTLRVPCSRQSASRWGSLSTHTGGWAERGVGAVERLEGGYEWSDINGMKIGANGKDGGTG
eukprot:364989-Chlamydomonas_euryale.AAC.2